MQIHLFTLYALVRNVVFTFYQIQYLYRHPVNVHPSFLTITGDFLRRRFESIEAAVKWIDEYDREMELAKAFENASLQGGEGKGQGKEREDVIAKMERSADKSVLTLASRTGRASDPSGLAPSVGMDYRKKIEKKRCLSEKKVVAVRGMHGIAGVRRRELLYQLVASNDGDEVERRGAILSTTTSASHFGLGSGRSLKKSNDEKGLEVSVEEVEVEMEVVESESCVGQEGAMEIEDEL